jgi:DNA-binding beta-propeller fold protein YncE
VIPISTATNTAGPPIKVAAESLSIAITPDGKTAYVVSSGSSGLSCTVTPISTGTDTPGPPIPLGYGYCGVVIAPDGKTAYVAISDRKTCIITPISTATNTPGPAIAFGHGRYCRIAIAPDGETAYLAESGMVTPVDLTTGHLAAPINIGSGLVPTAILFSSEITERSRPH